MFVIQLAGNCLKTSGAAFGWDVESGKIDSFSDHSMVEYINHLEAYALTK